MSIQELQNLITNAHDTSLIVPTESPNANTIYTLYEDGEITEQKGGWAYGQRNERVLVYGFDSISAYYRKCTFALQTDRFGYIITTLENAKHIRNYMETLIETS